MRLLNRLYPSLLDEETDANSFTDMHRKAKVPLSISFDTIQEYRQAGVSPGRAVAIIPPEIWLFMQHHAPEVLRNKTLFRLWLSRHPEYRTHEGKKY